MIRETRHQLLQLAHRGIRFAQFLTRHSRVKRGQRSLLSQRNRMKETLPRLRPEIVHRKGEPQFHAATRISRSVAGVNGELREVIANLRVQSVDRGRNWDRQWRSPQRPQGQQRQEAQCYRHDDKCPARQAHAWALSG
jgi:hypothetical protein